jgi:hypothetical protein
MYVLEGLELNGDKYKSSYALKWVLVSILVFRVQNIGIWNKLNSGKDEFPCGVSHELRKNMVTRWPEAPRAIDVPPLIARDAHIYTSKG